MSNRIAVGEIHRGWFIHRIRRYLVWAALIFSLFVVIAGSAVYFANLRAERRAEALLRAAHTLEIGKSTEQDVQQIVNRHGGGKWGTVSGLCSSASAGQSAVVDSGGLNWLGLKNAAFRPFGNRYWSVETVFLTSKGRVCAVLYFVRGLRADGNYEVSVRVYYQQDLSTPAYTQPPYYVFTRIYKNALDFSVAFTTEATEIQRQHALDFDLSCLSRFGGCREGCEIMPSAWLDVKGDAKENGWTIPADELADTKCQRR